MTIAYHGQLIQTAVERLLTTLETAWRKAAANGRFLVTAGVLGSHAIGCTEGSVAGPRQAKAPESSSFSSLALCAFTSIAATRPSMVEGGQDGVCAARSSERRQRIRASTAGCRSRAMLLLKRLLVAGRTGFLRLGRQRVLLFESCGKVLHDD